MALNSVVLPAPFSPTMETNSPSCTWMRDALQRLRLAVEHADILDLEQRRSASLKRAFGPRRRLDRAAEIDPAHGLVLMTSSAVPSAISSPRYIARRGRRAPRRSSRCGRPAAPRGLRRGSCGSVRRRSRPRRASVRRRARRPAPPCGSRAIAFAKLQPAQIGERQRRRDAGRITCAEADALGDPAGALGRACGRRNSMSRLSGSSASLMFSSTVCRCSGRECWNTMPTPLRAIRCEGQPADLDAVETDSTGGRPLDAHDELHHRRFAGAVRSDQAEDLAALQLEAEVLDGDRPPKRLVSRRTASTRSRVCPFARLA